jgi:hypothetical protein
LAYSFKSILYGILDIWKHWETDHLSVVAQSVLVPRAPRIVSTI